MDHNRFPHNEQPGLEVVPVTAPQVAYGEGLEFNHGVQTTSPEVAYGQGLEVDNNTLLCQQPKEHNSTISPWVPGYNTTHTVEAPLPPEKIPPQDRILGIPRRKFWLSLAALLVTVLVVALGLGLGLGLGLNTNDNTSR